ncbi:hypothetical protein [Enterococcus sp. DIV0187]|uniref:hypothetical protein n=1 Tax=Enterococcus sp. DIV0187 TaxID=2774644 RepID=UPI003F1F0CA6
MNPILQYEQGYISFEELADALWDLGPNAIFEIGEDWFRFYCDKVNCFHDCDYYIINYHQSVTLDDRGISIQNVE